MRVKADSVRRQHPTQQNEPSKVQREENNLQSNNVDMDIDDEDGSGDDNGYMKDGTDEKVDEGTKIGYRK